MGRRGRGTRLNRKEVEFSGEIIKNYMVDTNPDFFFFFFFLSASLEIQSQRSRLDLLFYAWTFQSPTMTLRATCTEMPPASLGLIASPLFGGT